MTFLHAETGIFTTLYSKYTLHARFRNKRSIYYIEKEITLDVVSTKTDRILFGANSIRQNVIYPRIA